MPEASQPRPERKQASVPPSQSLLDEGALQLIARALADPRRYAIIKRLAQLAPGLDCSSVRECMDISPPTLSHHMRELKLAGLVEEVRDGRTVHYTLRRETLREFLASLHRDLL